MHRFINPRYHGWYCDHRAAGHRDIVQRELSSTSPSNYEPCYSHNCVAYEQLSRSFHEQDDCFALERFRRNELHIVTCHPNTRRYPVTRRCSAWSASAAQPPEQVTTYKSIILRTVSYRFYMLHTCLHYHTILTRGS